jgi:hypothetical protein
MPAHYDERAEGQHHLTSDCRYKTISEKDLFVAATTRSESSRSEYLRACAHGRFGVGMQSLLLTVRWE